MLAALTASTDLSAQEQQERVVRELSFVGNKALDDLTLESAIATTKSSLWARSPFVRWLGLGEKRYFNELEFRRDVVRLILIYRQSGYMNVVVDTVVDRTPRDVYVEFRIHEGEPVRVTRLDVKGIEGIFNVDKLKRDLPLQVGDPFNRFLMQASADTIVQRLRDNGFPYAEVLRNFDSDAGERRAEVELDVQRGLHMRLGEVVIRGIQDVGGRQRGGELAAGDGGRGRVPAALRGRLLRRHDGRGGRGGAPAARRAGVARQRGARGRDGRSLLGYEPPSG